MIFPQNMDNEQANNPLHGIKLEMILNHLVEHYGWETMGLFIDIRCFNYDPCIKSSLAFLRKHLGQELRWKNYI